MSEVGGSVMAFRRNILVRYLGTRPSGQQYIGDCQIVVHACARY